MPRKPEWTQRVPAALEELGRFPAPVVDRATLERMLGLHRRAAIRLMHQLGGYQAGRTFLIDRQRLLAELEQIAKGEAFAVERERRTRLADELERTRRLLPARKVRIDAAPDVRDRVLQDLPAGIHLKPGELRIEFFGTEDLGVVGTSNRKPPLAARVPEKLRRMWILRSLKPRRDALEGLFARN